MTALLEARDVGFVYDRDAVLSEVDFALEAGELVAIVGPNGAGKSTLLKLLLGVVTPNRGAVFVEGKPILDLSRREIARSIAFVPQAARSDFAFTVREVVGMGRTPHLGRFLPPRSGDVEAVERALDRTETRDFGDRPVSELSGGERQRVHVARALAQETPILLLDEPTSNLDVEHQLQIFGLLRKLVLGGKGVAVAVHDLSLAARYASRIVVLSGGRVAASGKPDEVITEETLRLHFRVVARIERNAEDGVVVVVPVEPLDAGAGRAKTHGLVP
jgi:iron complex transport system ATP-binding protein